VVHAAATTYAARAAATDGAAAAARDRAKRAHYARAGVGEAYDRDLVPLSVDSFGRLRKPDVGPASCFGGRGGIQRGGLQEHDCDERSGGSVLRWQGQLTSHYSRMPAQGRGRFQPGRLVPASE
jgi:hypothetical protein